MKSRRITDATVRAVPRRRSVRVRITAAATLVFALAFGIAGFGLIARVRASLEDVVRQDSTEAVSEAQARVLAGGSVGPGMPPEKGVFVQAFDPDGHLITGTIQGDPDPDGGPAQPVGGVEGIAGSGPVVVGGGATGVAGGGAAGGGGAGGGGAGSGGVGVGAGAAVLPPEVLAQAGMTAGNQKVTRVLDSVAAPEGSPAADTLFVTQRVDTPDGPILLVASGSLANVRTTVDTLATVLVVGTPLLVALVGLLVWVLVGRALRPVEAIRAEVDEISHTTLDRRIATPGTGDEIHKLAVTMNEMLDRLDRAAIAQRRFVSDASHELKTPLATNRARLELALRQPDTTDWVGVTAEVLDTEERLDRLVADLLDMARLTEGPDRAAAMGPVDLREVVDEIVDRSEGVAIEVASSGAPPVVEGRPRELSRLVRNLVENAARHGGEHVRVTVGAEAGSGSGPGRATIVVEDDGPGIPPEHRDEVFERFTRLDESRQRSSGGTGLGLAIAHAVALGHRGTIAIDDSPTLGGARVTVSLPTP